MTSLSSFLLPQSLSQERDLDVHRRVHVGTAKGVLNWGGGGRGVGFKAELGFEV